jgi:DNA/RNA endonuclease YhcR with UshA esterase domain
MKMKKIIAMLLVLSMFAAFAACAGSEETSSEASTEASTEEVKVMTYAEYLAAEVGATVTVETYVQANQSWWNNSIVLSCQSADGGLFVYNLACSEENAAKLTKGTKIRVTGSKAEYDGEVEIMDATFEFVEGGDTYVAEAKDLTDKLGSDDLINYMNQLVTFKGLTFKSVEYKNGEPGDDIYVTLTKDGKDYSFCVEVYLTGTETDVYKTVGELKEGDVVDVTGFLYWYKGANPHITAITVNK